VFQVTEYGMSDEVGHISFDSKETVKKPYSQDLAELIDSEAKIIIDTAYQRTKALLQKHREHVDSVANMLIEQVRQFV